MIQALIIMLIVISVVLIGLLFIQSGKVKNVGSSIIGTKDVELFENTKRRGSERVLHAITWILIILFMLFAFLLVIL